jgi:hypothetical protein
MLIKVQEVTFKFYKNQSPKLRDYSMRTTVQEQGAILRSTYHRKQQIKKFPKARLCEP